jgi:hypothetical protein
MISILTLTLTLTLLALHYITNSNINALIGDNLHYKINSSTILWGIEDTPLHIEGISVSDVDISDDGYLQVTLACTNGTVRFHDSTIRDMLNVSYEVLFHGLLYEDGHQVRLPYPHQTPLLFSPLTHGMTALTSDIIIILLLPPPYRSSMAFTAIPWSPLRLPSKISTMHSSTCSLTQSQITTVPKHD